MSRPENAFIRGLSDPVFDRLSQNMTQVQLTHGVQVQWDGEPVTWVHFPITSVMSMIAANQGAKTTETSMAGCESADGLLEACASGVSSIDSVAQIDGLAFRSPASWCRRLSREEPDFLDGAWKIAELQLIESRQSALCRTVHKVEHRFARWLMESCERSGGRNPLPLTQEFLSVMLGVQRTTVTAFASKLQVAGLIRYRRGRVEILDVAGLERLACECRPRSREQRARLGLAVPLANLEPQLV